MLLDTWASRHGHPVQMRRGNLDDIDRFLEFELHLSPGTKYFRFGKFRDLGFDREQVVHIFDPKNDCNVHYIVTTTDKSCEVLLASGRLLISSSATACELLIVVRDDWHGAGLGSRLVTALCGEAKSRRIPAVYCQVLPTNRLMQSFMRSCGFAQTPNPDSEVLLRFEKSVASDAHPA